MYSGTKTEYNYKWYNERFQEWFNKKYGAKKPIEEHHAREFIGLMITGNKGTSSLIAALKFRFNYCERKAFVFKGLQKASKHENPHKVVPPDVLSKIFDESHSSIEMCVASRLLYELAARV